MKRKEGVVYGSLKCPGDCKHINKLCDSCEDYEFFDYNAQE